MTCRDFSSSKMDRKRASSSEDGGVSASGAKRVHLDAGSEDPEYDLLEVRVSVGSYSAI